MSIISPSCTHPRTLRTQMALLRELDIILIPLPCGSLFIYARASAPPPAIRYTLLAGPWSNFPHFPGNNRHPSGTDHYYQVHHIYPVPWAECTLLGILDNLDGSVGSRCIWYLPGLISCVCTHHLACNHNSNKATLPRLTNALIPYVTEHKGKTERVCLLQAMVGMYSE